MAGLEGLESEFHAITNRGEPEPEPEPEPASRSGFGR